MLFAGIDLLVSKIFAFKERLKVLLCIDFACFTGRDIFHLFQSDFCFPLRIFRNKWIKLIFWKLLKLSKLDYSKFLILFQVRSTYCSTWLMLTDKTIIFQRFCTLFVSWHTRILVVNVKKNNITLPFLTQIGFADAFDIFLTNSWLVPTKTLCSIWI